MYLSGIITVYRIKILIMLYFFNLLVHRNLPTHNSDEACKIVTFKLIFGKEYEIE